MQAAEPVGLTPAAQEQGVSRPAVGQETGVPWLTGDFALALAGALAVLSFSAALGFPRLADPGADNDSVMRLVEVRDLLAGQGWFDLTQYRMGPEGGFVMHWSRLVDAPIAGLMLLFRPLFGNAGAEAAAAIVWPTMLLVCSLFALLRAARAFGGEASRLPALVLGTAAFYFMGIFVPGALDHHNLQLTLVLAMTTWLNSERSFQAGLAAGAAAAASMAVGMETMPYLAAAGASAALLFCLRGQEEAPASAGFGAGLAGGAILCLVLTIRPADWFATTCDAFSGGQAGTAVLAGLGMASIAAFVPRRSGISRLAALAVLAAACAAFVIIVYPQCLADPYAGLEPRLRDYWLDWVSEAQSLRSLLVDDPAAAVNYYATALIGLGLALLRAVRSRGSRESLPVAILLAAAVAVSVWQVRGAIFSLSLAVIPLSAWVGSLRSRAAGAPSTASTLKMATAWLVSCNLVWGVTALLVSGGDASPTAKGAGACSTAEDFAALAKLPTGTVTAVSNLGASILAHSNHRVLAGPYHRNGEGNLATIDAMIAAPDQALATIRRHNVTHLAVCPGNPETRVLAERAPAGLLAGLVRGDEPDWLHPLDGSEGAALRIFRVDGN